MLKDSLLSQIPLWNALYTCCSVLETFVYSRTHSLEIGVLETSLSLYVCSMASQRKLVTFSYRVVRVSLKKSQEKYQVACREANIFYKISLSLSGRPHRLQRYV